VSGLSQLSLAQAQPPALHGQEGLIKPSSLGAESTIRAASDDALFQTPLLEQPCVATAGQGGGRGLLPTALLRQNPSGLLSSTEAGSIGSITHDENRCCSSSAGV